MGERDEDKKAGSNEKAEEMEGYSTCDAKVQRGALIVEGNLRGGRRSKRRKTSDGWKGKVQKDGEPSAIG